MTSTMWAYRLSAPGHFEECVADAPGRPRKGHVIVETTAGGICGSDLPFFKGSISTDGTATSGATGRPGFPMHEVVGTVVASEHPAHTPGDLVVGWASAFNGVAELVESDGEGLTGYDASLPPEVAILLQPLACVLYAVEQLGDLRDRHAAVLGLGPIGLLFAHVLSFAGAKRITGVDRVDRSTQAAAFGVDEVRWAPSDRWAADLESRPKERPDVVIEAVGHQTATVNHAIRSVADNGTVSVFGIPDEASQSVELRTVLRKNLTLIAGTTRGRRRMLAAASAYLAAHPDLRESYVTDVLPVSEVEAAYSRAASPSPGRAKVALTMT